MIYGNILCNCPQMNDTEPIFTEMCDAHFMIYIILDFSFHYRCRYGVHQHHSTLSIKFFKRYTFETLINRKFWLELYKWLLITFLSFIFVIWVIWLISRKRRFHESEVAWQPIKASYLLHTRGISYPFILRCYQQAWSAWDNLQDASESITLVTDHYVFKYPWLLSIAV